MWESGSFYTDLILNLSLCMTVCNEQQQDVICKTDINYVLLQSESCYTDLILM